MRLAQGPQRSDTSEAQTTAPRSQVKQFTTEPLYSLIMEANSMNPDQTAPLVQSDLGPYCLQSKVHIVCIQRRTDVYAKMCVCVCVQHDAEA